MNYGGISKVIELVHWPTLLLKCQGYVIQFFFIFTQELLFQKCLNFAGRCKFSWTWSPFLVTLMLLTSPWLSLENMFPVCNPEIQVLFVFPHLFSHEPEVPPSVELSLEVELLEATDAPDVELMPPEERIALASHKRERGNIHYQRGDYAFAVNSYSIALQITESNSKGEMQAMVSMVS